MERNLANWDRTARFILGTLLVVLALTGTIGIWGYLGLIFVATAAVSFCPIYRIFGLTSCQDC